MKQRRITELDHQNTAVETRKYSGINVIYAGSIIKLLLLLLLLLLLPAVL
jgi:hypothetical protein